MLYLQDRVGDLHSSPRASMFSAAQQFVFLTHTCTSLCKHSLSLSHLLTLRPFLVSLRAPASSGGLALKTGLFTAYDDSAQYFIITFVTTFVVLGGLLWVSFVLLKANVNVSSVLCLLHMWHYDIDCVCVCIYVQMP